MKTLPPEIWLSVLDAVPRKELRRCLSVCGVWHDKVIKRIFHTVHLYFGVWPEEYGSGAASFVCRSHEILAYISSNPSFASTIENIVIHSCSNRLGIFEATLSTALENLPQLLSFEWHSSDYLPITEDILGVLFTSCPQLRHLGLPNLRAGHVYEAFKQLQSISMTRSDYKAQDFASKTFSSVVNSDTFNKTGLRRIQLSHWSLHVAPGVGSPFTHLQELIFTSTDDTDPGDLESILQHTAHLESLELHDIREMDIGSLLGYLVQSLPSLTSLMLSGYIFDPFPGDFENIRAFIKSHSHMKRLCINIPIEWKYIDIFMPAIHGMTQLEALGLIGITMNDEGDIIPSTTEDFTSAIESIPRSIQALMLGTMLSSHERLIQDLSTLPSLEFLHILKSLDDIDATEYSLPSPQVLAHKIPHLAMIGLGDDICDVIHGSDGKTELYHWTLFKRRTRVSGDFDMAHAGWLLCNHDFVLSNEGF